MVYILLLLAILPLSLHGYSENNGFPVITNCYLQKNTVRNENCLERYFTSVKGVGRDGAWRVLDKKAIDWIDSLGRQAFERIKPHVGKCKDSKKSFVKICNTKQINRKRGKKSRKDRGIQKSKDGPWRRVRREIRTLSDTDRQEYFDAVNALKKDTVRKYLNHWK